MADKKKGESQASKIDEVARNQIWRERLRAEYEAESALTPFQLNPKTLSAVAIKPTMTHPADFANAHDDHETEKIAARLKEHLKKPQERSSLPMTEAQRIGWLNEMAQNGIRADMHRRMFKGRGSCDVTQFADTYCTMAGCSPFADKSTR